MYLASRGWGKKEISAPLQKKAIPVEIPVKKEHPPQFGESSHKLSFTHKGTSSGLQMNDLFALLIDSYVRNLLFGPLVSGWWLRAETKHILCKFR